MRLRHEMIFQIKNISAARCSNTGTEAGLAMNHQPRIMKTTVYLGRHTRAEGEPECLPIAIFPTESRATLVSLIESRSGLLSYSCKTLSGTRKILHSDWFWASATAYVFASFIFSAYLLLGECFVTFCFSYHISYTNAIHAVSCVRTNRRICTYKLPVHGPSPHVPFAQINHKCSNCCPMFSWYFLCRF